MQYLFKFVENNVLKMMYFCSKNEKYCLLCRSLNGTGIRAGQIRKLGNELAFNFV